MDGLEWSQFLLGSNTQLEGDTLNLNSPLNAIYKKFQDSWQSVQSIWKSKQFLFLFLKICVAILENNCTLITQWTTEKQGSELLADTHRQLVIVACWVSRVKYDRMMISLMLRDCEGKLAKIRADMLLAVVWRTVFVTLAFSKTLRLTLPKRARGFKRNILTKIKITAPCLVLSR